MCSASSTFSACDRQRAVRLESPKSSNCRIRDLGPGVGPFRSGHAGRVPVTRSCGQVRGKSRRERGVAGAMPDYGHELQFGSFLTPSNRDPQAVVALAQAAERAGLDLVTFQDHPYQPRFLDTWTLL